MFPFYPLVNIGENIKPSRNFQEFIMIEAPPLSWRRGACLAPNSSEQNRAPTCGTRRGKTFSVPPSGTFSAFHLSVRKLASG